MATRRSKKVVKMKQRYSYFLGIFSLIFAGYILVLFFQSFTQEHISIYEVNQKQLADNENLRGIILRNELVVHADQDGYVEYYVSEGSKLAASTTVYSISEDEQVAEAVSSLDTESVTLSEEDTRNIRSTIANFRNDFNLADYQKILNFRYNLENTLLELSDINLAENLKKIQKQKGNTSEFQLKKSNQTGIISFCTDGLEDLNLESISEEHFKEMTENWQQLRTSKEIKNGSPVYRVVVDEKWSIVVSLTKEQYQKLLKKDIVHVKIKKDNIETNPVVQTFTSDGKYYANLVFDKYMIHYLNNRYLDIELEFNNANGLKIPTSSIIEKNCYKLPSDYITKGTGTSNSDGIVTITYNEKNGAEQLNFVPVEVYYRDEEGYVYIDTKVAEPGTTILRGADLGADRIQLSITETLTGVYNCNQGYCKFRYVNKLYENAEYAIIEKGNAYSLANFDHIILNPETITENDILY